MRHDPRSMRTIEERDVPFFRALGPAKGNFTIPPINHGRGIASQTNGLHGLHDGLLVQGDAICFLDANALILNADAHYNDVDHKEEMEDAYGDILPTPI